MATLSHANSKRKYSWWWDSHISPKNSKWLQENLTDMDSKVKQMIKLIEEDADSFARRAEMYYKKRPELMKMVEEFYRAYRALAERYDHATGVIRDAHQTMPEAFSNQIPMMDETEVEPHTPDVRHPSRLFLETDELQKDSSTNFPSMKRIGAHTEEPDSALNKRGFKPLIDHVITGEHVNGAKFDGGHARRGLNFIGTQESKGINNGSHDSRAGVLSQRVTKAETEILALKKSLAKLETEKEAGLLQYQQSLERLSNMELEMSHAREKSQGLDERASKAEAEVQSLKQALTVLQAEMEASLNQYQECLKKITNLEKNISFAQKDARELNERATRSESDAESLKQDLARVEAERDAALVQYKQCRESLSKMEQRLEEAEEKARRINEQADKAESEIEALKLEVAKITEEKEDAAFRYEQCLEIISSVKQKLSCAEDEVRRLNSKVDDGDEKLLSSEQKCLQLETSNHTLQSELQSLAQKLGSQNVELSEKQRELNTLWISLQYERLRFFEAMAEDVGSTGLDPKCFGESVNQFQDDNSKLKEIFKSDKSEKASLPEKLEIMEKLLEKNSVLENSLSNLNAEMESVRGKVKVLEETCQSLSYELHKGTNEVEQWETQAAPLYAELLISAVNETLFEGKVSELAYACENLESRNYSKEMEIELLKETVSKLEGENGKLHDHLAAYVPTVSALNDCITSLEMHTLVHARPHEYEEPKVQDLVNHQYTENGQQTGKDHTVMTLDALLNLEDMQRRISAIEMEVKQINFEPKDEIREAKQQHHGSINEFEVLPKDIMLDQISERSNGISIRRTLEADDQMFKSRETTDKDDTVEVDKTQVMAQKGATDEWENKYPASEFLVEKEFSVDKLENSRRLTQAHENGNKSNVLELLDSDAQKLTNLQITIQELMKVKVIETGKKGKYIEYDSVKDQLEAAQETIRKLFEAIHKLKKNMEEGRMPFDEKAAVESGEIGSVSRKRETEHAWRRMAEKLGWLQLDVKRRLSVLLKQGGVKDVKEKAEDADHHGPRVLLRDYFYGRIRNNKEKKRAKFCACMKPSTL